MLPCPYCGNNPVPHLIYWYNESLNILLTPVRQKLLYNFFTRWIKGHGFDQTIAQRFLAAGEVLGIISRQKNSQLCKVRRAQVLWEEAGKRNIEMQELLLFGRPFDVYVARLKSIDYSLKTLVFSGLPRPAGYSNNVLDLMDDKGWLKQILIQHHLPVPAGAAVTDFSQAKKVFDGIQGRSVPIYGRPGSPMNRHATQPVIVKPRAGSRGRHSTTFVSTEEDLRRAVKIAKQLCHWVMVEEQLQGPVYRATVVNYELCGVLRGDPPQVTGDGQKNISELIKQKNFQPHPGQKNIADDHHAKLFLSRQGLTFLSILPKGQTVNLSEKIGVSYGGSSSEDFEVCHPDNKELFIRAAKVLGDPLVGFDFIIPDIAKSYKEQRAGFIEVNSLPFINLHHDPLLGQGRNVAAKVWEMLGW